MSLQPSEVGGVSSRDVGAGSQIIGLPTGTGSNQVPTHPPERLERAPRRRVLTASLGHHPLCSALVLPESLQALAQACLSLVPQPAPPAPQMNTLSTLESGVGGHGP